MYNPVLNPEQEVDFPTTVTIWMLVVHTLSLGFLVKKDYPLPQATCPLGLCPR